MVVKLFKRHLGIHSHIKEIEIDLDFKKVVKKPKDPNDDFIIDEKSIINLLPKKFLPAKPEKILLTVGDKNGSTGQRRPKIFKPWGKYFNSYSVELAK